MKNSNIPLYTNSSDMNNDAGLKEIAKSGSNDSFDVVQKLYQQGFRCIKYDDALNEKMHLYLQNFDIEENTKTLEITNEDEKLRVMNFINKYE